MPSKKRRAKQKRKKLGLLPKPQHHSQHRVEDEEKEARGPKDSNLTLAELRESLSRVARKGKKLGWKPKSTVEIQEYNRGLEVDDPDSLREALEVSFPDPTPLKTVTHRAWEAYVHFGYEPLGEWLTGVEQTGRVTIRVSEFGAKYRQEFLSGTRAEEDNVDLGWARLRAMKHNEADLDRIAANPDACDVKMAHVKLVACFKCFERGASEKYGRCGGCTIAVYCSRECQKNHWSEHKGVCQKFAAVLRLGAVPKIETGVGLCKDGVKNKELKTEENKELKTKEVGHELKLEN
mmetsp:Transcript_11670/g.28751  ORF Transcript_11670/g.28751 Transcript_11670/m.28751 type:complete len:292 (-) Transcript_11670:309-1184(-)|eukprot:CAMPEP_0114500108 /NCGR_PEP_ID=MMETSP0109-20121206/7781_1 /TAXON_ID=29199 /ORGANISM="Chlorarachnion reptans, Strain CCCM449" /LENGTH=291 /DNA_ID=CAMNT_0001677733 /DNA_START=210 /DNA_END=1085 /DNA_ORIENTATION=+